jgi:hypothetical protein
VSVCNCETKKSAHWYVNRARYSFGGAIATRLGATDFVNTIVIAHPISLKSAEIRAIKVNPGYFIMIRLEVILTALILQVPTSWLLAEGSVQ